jgi:hypothetical protein
MQASTDRILTTHTGSLPRSKALSALLVKREQRKPFDPAALADEIARNMDANLRRQAEAGVDIGNDGETPRVGFSTYTTERMTGFGGESLRKPTLDTVRFPGFADFMRPDRHLGRACQGLERPHVPRRADLRSGADRSEGGKSPLQGIERPHRRQVP